MKKDDKQGETNTTIVHKYVKINLNEDKENTASLLCATEDIMHHKMLGGITRTAQSFRT
jgi:hypothetical protein